MDYIIVLTEPEGWSVGNIIFYVLCVVSLVCLCCVMIFSAYLGTVGIRKRHISTILRVVSVCVVIGCGLLTGVKFTKHFIKMEVRAYKITAIDTINPEEFESRYELIRTDGKIYTVVDRGD